MVWTNHLGIDSTGGSPTFDPDEEYKEEELRKEAEERSAELCKEAEERSAAAPMESEETSDYEEASSSDGALHKRQRVDEGASPGGGDDATDSAQSLEVRILYSSDEPDWASEKQAAEACGKDEAWLNKLKEKRRSLHEALSQVERATTHAAVLGIDADADASDVRTAFLRLSRQFHTDKHPHAPDDVKLRLDSAFNKVQEAKDKAEEPEAKRRAAEAKREAKRKAKLEADRKRAEEISNRATEFTHTAQLTICPPKRAANGTSQWPRPGQADGPAHLRNVNVDFLKVDSAKVPPFGTVLKTEDGKEVALEPTETTTLLLEAGCSAEKTRKLITWILKQLETVPDMPILFVSCRKTHADDLWTTTLNDFGLEFVNYRDAQDNGAESKTKYMEGARRLIVSLQSLHLINLDLYKGGLICIDEFRSAMSIPGSKTLPQLHIGMECYLKPLCTHARFRVMMDADVSADGAVEAGLRTIAGGFDLVHVQLQKAALRRVVNLGFGEPKGSTGRANFEAHLELWMKRVRYVREEWVDKRKAQMKAAKVQLWLAKRRWAKEDETRGVPPSPEVKAERARQLRRLNKLKKPADPERSYVWLMYMHRLRERCWARKDAASGVPPSPEVEAERARLSDQVMWRCEASKYDRQRVLISCATPSEARKAAKMCDELGVAYHYYSGSSDDREKREHFGNTTKHWWQVAVIIATTTMTVAVNVRIHFSAVFLWVHRGEQAGRLRELLQALVRVGRDEDDPLEDENIYTFVPGAPPDFAKFKYKPPEERFKAMLADTEALATTAYACDRNARGVGSSSRSVGGDLDEPTVQLSNPLNEVVTWNKLEGADNCGDRAVCKLVLWRAGTLILSFISFDLDLRPLLIVSPSPSPQIELCMLPTRAWAVQLMPALTVEEQAESDALAKEKTPELAPRSEDQLVSQMSMSDKYGWLIGSLRNRANKDAQEEAKHATVPIDTEQRAKEIYPKLKEQYYNEQRMLRNSEHARSDKSGCEIAKENIFKVIDPLGYLPDLKGDTFSKLARCDTMEKVMRRAVVSTMPLDEQRKVYEVRRRKGQTPHPMVERPWHMQTELLQRLCTVLELAIDRLLGPTTFTSEDVWVQIHNRRRRGAHDSKIADEAKVKQVIQIAKDLGATVTSQMSLQKLLQSVLRSVLNLSPCNPEEPKVPCDAPNTADGRAHQLTQWVIKDEWAELIPDIHLDMVRPDGRLEKVKQSKWRDRHEQLLAEAEEMAWQGEGMEVDEEEQVNADLAARGGGAVQSTIDAYVSDLPRFDEFSKTEKFSVEGIQNTLGELRSDEGRRGEVSKRTFEELSRARLQLGSADGFKAAAVVLLALNGDGQLSVLLALERRQFGRNRAPFERFDFIGGKREAGETPLQTAAREAFEETAGLFTAADRQRLETGAAEVVLTECWETNSKAMLFAYQLTESDVAARVDALNDFPLPGCPNLVRLKLVPLRELLNDGWARSNLHTFCRGQLNMMHMWLSGYLSSGVVPPPMPRVQPPPAQVAELKTRVQKLEGWYHDLQRCDGLQELFQSLHTKAESMTHVNGRVHFDVSYERKGVGGRRYAKGDTLSRRHGDRYERTVTLQAMHSDARGRLVGIRAYDIDCENGDFRLIKSLGQQLGLEHMTRCVCEYVEHRKDWLDEIQRIHDVDKGTAKRLLNVVCNGGGYRTWLEQNQLPFIPRAQWCQKVLALQKELIALRKVLFDHQRFKAMVEVERKRHQDEGVKSEYSIEASLMSFIVQTCEDQVLSVIDRTFFDAGWAVLALIFDGLIVEPSGEGGVPREELLKVLKLAEEACTRAGWGIKLDDKPLHGTQDEPVRTIVDARKAMSEFEAWACALGPQL